MQRLIDEAGLSEKPGGKRYKKLYDLYRQGQGFADPFDQQLLAEEMQKLVTDPKFEAAVEKNLRTKQSKQLYDTTLKHYENVELPPMYSDIIQSAKNGLPIGEDVLKSFKKYVDSGDFIESQSRRTSEYQKIAANAEAAPFIQAFEGMTFTANDRATKQARLFDLLKANKYEDARQFLKHSAVSSMVADEKRSYEGKVSALHAIDYLKKTLEGIEQGYFLEPNGTKTPILDSKGRPSKIKTGLYEGTAEQILRKVGVEYPLGSDPALSRLAGQIAYAVNNHVAMISGMGVSDKERAIWSDAYPTLKGRPELNYSKLDGLRAMMENSLDGIVAQKLGGLSNYNMIMSAGQKKAAAASGIGGAPLTFSILDNVISSGQANEKPLAEADLNKLRDIKVQYTDASKLSDPAARLSAKKQLMLKASQIIHGSGFTAEDVLKATPMSPTPPQARPLGPDESTRVLRINPFEPPSPSSGQSSPSASIPAPSSPSSTPATGADGEIADILQPKETPYEGDAKDVRFWEENNGAELDGIISKDLENYWMFTIKDRSGVPKYFGKKNDMGIVESVTDSIKNKVEDAIKRNRVRTGFDEPFRLSDRPGLNDLVEHKINQKVVELQNQSLGRKNKISSDEVLGDEDLPEAPGSEVAVNAYGEKAGIDLSEASQAVRMMIERDESISGDLNTIVSENLERSKRLDDKGPIGKASSSLSFYNGSYNSIRDMASRLVDASRGYDPETKKFNKNLRNVEVQKVQFELHLEWLRRAAKQMDGPSDPRIVYAVEQMKEKYKNIEGFQAKIDAAAGSVQSGGGGF